MTTQAKRRLTDIKFEHEGAHVALVSVQQGGPANGVTTLITKALNKTEQEELTVETIEKSVHEQLLNEAVAAAVEVEKAAGVSAVAEIQKALDEQTEILKAAQAQIADFEAQAEARKVEARKAALVDAKVSADKVEGILKSLAPLSDEAFTATVATMKSLSAGVDNSELMQEQGVAGAGAESTEEVDRTTQIIKQRYGIK